MARPRFRLVETTADAGLIVWGESFGRLLENAASGLSRIIGGYRPASRQGRERRFIRARGRDRESLLVAWLGEWLYLFEREGFLGNEFTAETAGSRFASGSGIGRICGTDDRETLTEVKGITYHGLQVRESGNGLTARLVLDL